ncbi:esterase-like activity of phytase family protein [Muricoccus radiodurans]|uniref:esterase-like activity of phytase family protein n=1 Tax=Muricoccus radiodurans TaxID=2231721 RepID=UPI003CED0948
MAVPLTVSDSLPDAPLRHLGTLDVDTEALGAEGLSGLHIAPDLTLTAVSDLGRWCRARLVLAPNGAPLGLETPVSGWLRDPVGRPLPRGLLGDAESLAALPDGGWLVGFERHHRIWRYRRLDGPAEVMPPPPGLNEAPLNASLEALGALADGRWLVITEGLAPRDDPSVRIGWIGGPGRWRRLLYQPGQGYDPSDLCPLPDGGALVLERHFAFADGFSARIVHLPGPLPAAPHRLEGTELVRLEPPLPTDNWEGISAFRHGGRMLVAVLSDDNALFLQRTLLSVFAWPEASA